MSPAQARYAVIGSPIAHSLSPLMQQAAFDALRIDAAYEAVEADVGRAREVFTRLRTERYAGWNVTTPLKEAAMSLVDRVTADVTDARAVNTVRMEGDG
ncbi:MAG TPA: hypothetical protein VGW96_07700, partial [Candidatus Eremiobacteraceae bacterium]|nr:hypothetical protein [Candidatus Eremiobacteraceae bacterium]